MPWRHMTSYFTAVRPSGEIRQIIGDFDHNRRAGPVMLRGTDGPRGRCPAETAVRVVNPTQERAEHGEGTPS